MVIRQRGDYVSVKSLTKPVNRRGQREGSRLRVQLRVVDETKLIGEWQERTSKDRLYFGSFTSLSTVREPRCSAGGAASTTV